MARRRPQPNARRGLIRAGLTGIVLIIVAILAVELVSSLTASTVKAPGSTTLPTPPATPGPLQTPTTNAAIPTAAVPTARPGATTSATKKQKDVSYLQTGRDSRPLMERGAGALLRHISRATTEEATVRGKLALAQFRVSATGNSPAPLLLSRLPSASGRSADRAVGVWRSATSVNAGMGDPYVRPVWSNDGRRILFVLDGPHSGWTLLQYDLTTHRRLQLATVKALDAEPLGWLHGSPLFTVTSQADTSLVNVVRGKLVQVSILMPQAVTTSQMSPDGRYIAFTVPANCLRRCTLDWFDTQALKTHFGPTGIANKTAFGWLDGGQSLFAVLHGHLALLNSASGATVLYTLPSNMPSRLLHILRGRSAGSKIVLYDTVSGAKYVGTAASH